MQYDQIEADAVEQQTLEQDAAEAENRAIMMEYESIRQEVLGNKAGAKVVGGQAAIARKEADAFTSASEFSDDKIQDLKVQGVNNIIRMLETQHRQAEVRKRVREDAGIPTTDFDSQMAELEMLKDAVVERMLSPLTKPAKTKRTNAGNDQAAAE